MRVEGERAHSLSPNDGKHAEQGRIAAIRIAALEQFAVHGYRAATMEAIGARAGIRGPSLYKHVRSKQQLLSTLMLDTMHQLLALQEAALSSSSDRPTQLRRAVEAHVRYHARHRYEAFVGTREIDSLEDPHRSDVIALRGKYERTLRKLIDTGATEGCFNVRSVRLVTYAILDMGMGVSVWFREGREYTADDVAYFLGEMALRLLGVSDSAG